MIWFDSVLNLFIVDISFFATWQCCWGIKFFGCPSAAFDHSSGQILLPWNLINGLNILDETDSEYTLPPTDHLTRPWKLKVKVMSGFRGGKSFHVCAGW